MMKERLSNLQKDSKIGYDSKEQQRYYTEDLSEIFN